MMSTPKPRIALLRQGSFSHINDHIEQILRVRFSNYDLDVVDVQALLNENFKLLLTNIPCFVQEYGFPFRNSLAQHRKNFYRTTRMFCQVKHLINQIVTPERYLFSLQTQSFFDLSTPGLPHYVYTDHAILSNLAYPNVTMAYITANYPPSLIALERNIYKNATVVFTMGKFVAETLINDYGCAPEKVVAIGGGSNLTQEKLLESNRPSVARFQAKNILFLGVAWERKGGPALLRAFEKLRHEHPTATLTIVGCKPDINVKNCTVVGTVPLADVQAYYNQASIFCLPSLREPFGVAFIEASMSRLPIVATNIGAIPEIVLDGESGLLVDPNDQHGLVHALDRLLSDPTISQEFGTRGYEFVRTKYTWDAVGNQLFNHIHSSLS